MVKNWGIRTRVLLLALLPAVMIAVVLAGYMVYRVSADAERELNAYGSGLSRQLAAVSEFSAYSGDRDALRQLALAALDETHVIAVAFFNAEGLPVASSGSGTSPIRLASMPPSRQPVLLGSDATSLLFAAPIVFHRFELVDTLLPESAQATAARSSAPAAPIGWVTLNVSRAAMQQRKREAMFFSLLSTFVVMALAGVLAMMLGRQVTEPILRLEDAVARIQAGQLEVRVPTDSGGDLQRLEEGMNSMAEVLLENRTSLQRRIAVATHELEEKKNEAERLNIAKSRFLAAASHDLRQPLHALSLFAADLERASVTTAQQRLSRQINESVTSMAGLLDALLDISRFDLSEIAPLTTALPLDDLFRHLEAGFSRLAQDKGLRFVCRPSTLWTNSDPVLLERLLANLVANAIAYTDCGGVLVVARIQGDTVRVEVRDSGIGIAAEYSEAIFEEFFQIGNAGRVQGMGLGLGLAIVRRIASLLGVNVALRSVLGRGSVFSVTLPVIPAPQLPSEPEALQVAPCGLVLLRPETAQLDEVAALAARWGIEWVWADSWEAVREVVNERAVVVDMLERFSCAAAEVATAARLSLILLGNAGESSLAAYPPGRGFGVSDGISLLSLPLRPAKLRALLSQLSVFVTA